jgi:hypothetical protein
MKSKGVFLKIIGSPRDPIQGVFCKHPDCDPVLRRGSPERRGHAGRSSCLSRIAWFLEPQGTAGLQADRKLRLSLDAARGSPDGGAALRPFLASTFLRKLPAAWPTSR